MYNLLTDCHELCHVYCHTKRRQSGASDMATEIKKTVSARLPESLLRKASFLRPQAKLSEMVREAFAAWVDQLCRQHEDEVITNALASIAPERRKQERKLVDMAGRSALRVMEKVDG